MGELAKDSTAETIASIYFSIYNNGKRGGSRFLSIHNIFGSIDTLYNISTTR
jgi:hypothetical protein